MPLDETIAKALDSFQNKLLSIEAQVMEKMQLEPSLKQFVQNVDFHFSRKIIAALIFGDLGLLERELIQMRELIQHFGFPIDALNHYLSAFSSILRNNLEDHGKPIIDWLDTYLQQYAAKPIA